MFLGPLCPNERQNRCCLRIRAAIKIASTPEWPKDAFAVSIAQYTMGTYMHIGSLLAASALAVLTASSGAIGAAKKVLSKENTFRKQSIPETIGQADLRSKRSREDMNTEGHIREVRKGADIISMHMDLCYPTFPTATSIDRVVLPLKSEDGKVVGMGESEIGKESVAVSFNRQEKVTANFRRDARIADVTYQGSIVRNSQKGDLEFSGSYGYLEKLISMPIADLASVNIYESEREQSRIIWRQFCGERPVRAIFRGALMSLEAPTTIDRR
jgi:hypothetical protein